MSDISLPFVRSENNYDRMAVSDATALRCPEPSLTQQQFKKDSDINTIVETYTRTGVLPNHEHQPTYGDFTDFEDFHSTMNRLLSAQDDFMALPASVRARFANDPGQLLDFIADSSNYDEAVKLGLVPPKEDLSIAPVDAPTKGKAKGAVGKSGQQASAAPSLSNGDSGGNEGDA